MNWTQLEPMVDELQRKEISTMTRIEKLVDKNDNLPSVPMSFNSAKKLIEENEYNVVVCGEVKKGKSSLLNAIIGQEILPVNNEIATSQVFRISNSEQESFELVFTDGTRQAISKKELSHYGSQVDANRDGEPVFKGRSLAFIQVNVPITFLPKGVSLVDTPGLGALYKSHEWITQSYLRHASAVVFVLDPESPITAQEKAFILRALDVTEDILFLMTKIDKFAPEVWDAQLQRDASLLADIYAEKGCVMPQIMPVSSVGLMKASTSKVEQLKNISLKNSHFPEFKSELIKMMFKGVGVNRTALALKEASDHTAKIQRMIDDMLRVCSVDSSKEEKLIIDRIEHQQETLRQNWGAESQRRSQVVQQISNVCQDVHNEVSLLVSVNGPVYTEYANQIEALRSMKQVEDLSKTMPQSVINDVSMQWKNIAAQAESKVAAILSGVNTEINSIGTKAIWTPSGDVEVRELSILESLKCYMIPSGIGIGSAVLLEIAGAFVAPIGTIIGAGVALVSWLFGRGNSKATELEDNKKQFRQKLSELMNELSGKLMGVEKGEKYSVVSQFTHDLNQNAQRAVQDAFERKEREMNNNIERVERQAREDLESKKRAEKEWKGLKNNLDVIIREIKDISELQEDIHSAVA
jgi:GTP-binding protein EngB required for normal cell division/gas vesicle protein